MEKRQTAPAAERNKEPILAVLRRVLPESGLVLEIASGTGQHVVHFAGALPRLTWQPSDPDPQMRASIAAWVADAALPNLQPPLDLDVLADEWPIERADAVVCLNMIHIAPWAATLHLMAGASRLLPARGVLVLYGPFRRFSRHTAPSNEMFDAQLRRTDLDWGVRDLEVVASVAEQNGFALDEVVEMPANNLSVVFRRA
jgi:SAM-dependent methyltransferase